MIYFHHYYLIKEFLFTVVWAAIASVGWYILGALIAFFFASPYLADKYRKWKNRKDEQEYEAKYKKGK